MTLSKLFEVSEKKEKREKKELLDVAPKSLAEHQRAATTGGCCDSTKLKQAEKCP